MYTVSCGAYGNFPAQVFTPPAAPNCAGTNSGTLLGPWTDSAGESRYACVWYPTVIPNPAAMVVYFHPSQGNAAQTTLLSNVVNTADLGDGTGYILLSIQGRNTTHFYPSTDNPATGWDNWYRVMPSGTTVSGGISYQQNLDAEATDHFISVVQGLHTIDSHRIYMMAWSNGTAFAILYATNRTNIAAVSVYSGPDPWAFLQDPCEQVATPVTNTAVPIEIIHKDHDLWGLCPNIQRMISRLTTAGLTVTEKLISSLNQDTIVGSCSSSCGTNGNGDATATGSSCSLPHATYPNHWILPGTATDGIGQMGFLKANPLP